MRVLKEIAIVAMIVGAVFTATGVWANKGRDLKLTSAVEAALINERDILEQELKISTRDGVVKINGVVDTRLQMHKIIELTQSVDGVKDVDTSKLEIKSSDDFLGDAIITAKVKGKILQLTTQKRLGNHSLHVETTNGVVHILGKIEKENDKDTIKNAVVRINDVKGVNFNVHD